MAEATKIAWAGRRLPDGSIEPGYSFNPWWGCQEVSEGCAACYARSFSKRVGYEGRLLPIWGGTDTDRRFFGDKHWAEPLKWERIAVRDGVQRKVFCSSMADVFEDRADLEEHRQRLWSLIIRTPHLIWLLLTKRPENVMRLAPWETVWPENVWLGVTAENRRRAEERIPVLCEIPARIRFVSYEPALELVSFKPWLHKISWVIVGGESGGRARPFDPAWADNVVGECRGALRAPFVKQLGSRAALKHPHGADPAEWPRYLRVQEWPL